MRLSFAFLILTCFGFISCQSLQTSNMSTETESHSYTNHLIHESSPYLLQHAHNPVNWYPWGDEALSKAKEENKLMLISIGYSSCHWCHVMEHESFEDTAVAAIMNKSFVCIKVDREERPDIDQVYMTAVQLMTGRGGWPLNCFTLPDGRPIYGGTYFPKSQWQNVLQSLANLYKTDPKKAEEYAEQLTQGIHLSEIVSLNPEKADFSVDTLSQTVNNWKSHFDSKEGGPNYAPKFPMPNNYSFLLRYGSLIKDDRVLNHVYLTLHKMAFGGIYDQVGGGFARYSTDSLWKVPHFEKMLYDNAQLVSLYSEAYQATKDPLYRQVVFETLDWVKREMTNTEGAFYSALDADSEGIEGRYYVWTKEELEKILGADFDLFSDYYNVNDIGFWEDKQYILLRKKTDEEIANQHHLALQSLQQKIGSLKQKLLKIREGRVHPGLDDKSLTSWNAMMIRGYTDAYRAFNKQEYLNAALKNANFILVKQYRDDGGLYHSYKNDKSSINGFLEDYGFVIDAFISLYQATFDEEWLRRANKLGEYTFIHFYDERSGMFYFTSDLDSSLIVRKMELQDNVIPSSNSVMANNFFMLGNYFDNNKYLEASKQMLNNVKNDIPNWGGSYSNWSLLMMDYVFPFYEIAVVGEDAGRKRRDLDDYFIPNKLFVGSKGESTLPLLEYKYVEGKTMIYVCENKMCRLPVTEVKEAVKQVRAQ